VSLWRRLLSYFRRSEKPAAPVPKRYVGPPDYQKVSAEQRKSEIMRRLRALEMEYQAMTRATEQRP
jgi:hypothetical protein